MRINLAYGKTGMEIKIPDRNLAKIFAMKKQPAVSDPYIALVKGLLRPIGFENSLFDRAMGKKSACIVIPDITRPMPNRLILAPILRTLNAAGLSPAQITLLIATGSHRPNTKRELQELVGREILKKYRVLNHDCHDTKTHQRVGTSPAGREIWIDRRYLEAEIKIATGFIEPHFMAGFSGGRKSIVPGIAGYRTIQQVHGPELMGHPDSQQGILQGNPFHEELLAVVKQVGVDFIVNVSLDEAMNITGIYCGDVELAHQQGVQEVRRFVTDTIDEPVDVAITTGAGHPLDATWYQTIKGVTAAAPIVKKNGTIIVASECSEGIGSKEFSSLLREYTDYDRFLADIRQKDFHIKDQWQLQKFVAIAQVADVVLVSDKLTKNVCYSFHLNWAESVEVAILPILQANPHLRIGVLPKGPYILPGLSAN